MSGGPHNFGREFETEFEHSIRAGFGMALGDWYRLEFLWLREFEWSDRLAVTRVDATESAEFLSRLGSREINLRRRAKIRDWPQHYPDYWNSFEFSVLIGFRWLDLDEELVYRNQTDASFESVSVRTANQMAGIQLGGLAQWLYEDRGWLDLEVKGAILSNDIDLSSATNSVQSNEHRTSFLVDATLVVNYQFSSSTTLRLGYNMMWVSGAALAAENTPTREARQFNASHDGETIYHGPSIGLVFAR